MARIGRVRHQWRAGRRDERKATWPLGNGNVFGLFEREERRLGLHIYRYLGDISFSRGILIRSNSFGVKILRISAANVMINRIRRTHVN